MTWKILIFESVLKELIKVYQLCGMWIIDKAELICKSKTDRNNNNRRSVSLIMTNRVILWETVSDRTGSFFQSFQLGIRSLLELCCGYSAFPGLASFGV